MRFYKQILVLHYMYNHHYYIPVFLTLLLLLVLLLLYLLLILLNMRHNYLHILLLYFHYNHYNLFLFDYLMRMLLFLWMEIFQLRLHYPTYILSHLHLVFLKGVIPPSSSTLFPTCKLYIDSSFTFPSSCPNT